MRKVTIFVLINILLLVDSAQAGLGWRGGGYKSNSQPSSAKSNPEETLTPKGKVFDSKSQSRAPRSLGISAWGIIGIIIGAILLSTIAYYAFVLYPYLCEQSRSYDMIELTDSV